MPLIQKHGEAGATAAVDLYRSTADKAIASISSDFDLDLSTDGEGSVLDNSLPSPLQYSHHNHEIAASSHTELRLEDALQTGWGNDDRRRRWIDVAKIARDAAKAIADAAAAAWNAAVNFVNEQIANIRKRFEEAINAVKQRFEEMVSSALESIKKGLQAVTQGIQAALQAAREAIEAALDAALSFINGSLKKAFKWIADAVLSLFDQCSDIHVPLEGVPRLCHIVCCNKVHDAMAPLAAEAVDSFRIQDAGNWVINTFGELAAAIRALIPVVTKCSMSRLFTSLHLVPLHVKMSQCWSSVLGDAVRKALLDVSYTLSTRQVTCAPTAAPTSDPTASLTLNSTEAAAGNSFMGATNTTAAEA